MATEGEIIRVVLYYTAPNASVAQTVHWYQLDGGDADDDDIMDTLQSWGQLVWGADWDDSASQDALLDYLEADVINTDGTVQRNMGFRDLNIAGTVADPISAAQIAALVTSQTAIPKVRGRKYIPFFADAQLIGGSWTAGALADIAALLADYFEPIIIAGATQLVAGVLSTVTAEFIELIQGGNVRGLPKTQRRRYANVGS